MLTRFCYISVFFISLSTYSFADSSSSFAVLELFTSQGCSSCPPADKLLKKYSELAKSSKHPIYTLSYHVDYWNYLGWDDPYSNKLATQRQYEYSRAFKRKGVYTPQLVINGRGHVVGSKEKEVRTLVNTELGKATSNHFVGLTNVKIAKGAVSFSVDLKSGSSHTKDSDLQIFAAITEDQNPNSISSGENRGRTLSHTNVVKSMKSFPSTTPSFRLQLPKNTNLKKASLTVLIQKTASMEIVAATSKALTPQ